MAQHRDVRSTGDRVEAILAQLSTSDDPAVAAAAEELVRLLVELYGESLRQVMTIAADTTGLAERLAADPLIGSLLLVHDLHPVAVDTRIQRALDEVRPYLGSHAGGVRYHGIDQAGVVQLALEGTCHGCPSSTVTVRLAIEQAVREAAPEICGVEVAGQVPEPVGPALLRIGRRPPAAVPRPVADVPVDEDGWARLPLPGTGGLYPVAVAGDPVLLCSVGDELFAYRDRCPECGAALSGGDLTAQVLRCAECGRTFDVRRAGIGLSDPARRLHPLPLLADATVVRIAVGLVTTQ